MSSFDISLATLFEVLCCTFLKADVQGAFVLKERINMINKEAIGVTERAMK